MTDLDFSGLMNIGADDNVPAPTPADTPEKDTERLNYELNQMRAKHKQTVDGYKDLQEKKRLTNEAKTAFIRRIEAGDADVKSLLVDAISIIETATHDTAFKNASIRNLNDNY